MDLILSNLHTWALVLGLITPALTSVAQNPRWSQPVRVLVSAVVALLIGVVTVLANGQFDPADWFTTLGIVLAASQAAYGLVYKPTGLAKVIELHTIYQPKHRRGA